MILELLTTTVGAAVAKLALAWWFKEPSFVVEAGSGIVESLTKITHDTLTARRSNRQYETISERAAERLEVLLRHEYSTVTPTSLEAVCHAVDQTVGSVPVALDLFTRFNHSPIRLADYYYARSRKYTSGLANDEVALFKRLLQETCNLAIDFASGLPRFTQRTLAEILRRDDLIISAIDEVAGHIKALQDQNYLEPRFAGRAFRLDYVRTLIRSLGWMELFGADLSAASRQHSLNVAYINLSVRKQSAKGDGESIVVKADRAISQSKRLFIRGPAGCGKTTLLKWIAVSCASEDFVGDMSAWNNITPLFLRLRQCVQLDRLPAPETFPSLVAPHIAHEMPRGWVHDLLRSGDAVVLIDGVDEISRRTEVRQWIDDLVATFPDARYIVTSRPLARGDVWTTPAGFDEAELLPMEPTDISLFVDNWHTAVKEEVQYASDGRELDQLAESLKALIHQNEAIRGLATVPVLCAMICALHKDTNQQVPRNRVDLYEACTKMLIEDREKAQGIRIENYPDLTYKEIIKLLSDLAYYLLSNGWSEVSKGRAKDRLAMSARALRSVADDISQPYATKILRMLVERTGMVREPSEGTLDFAHRTFQEYLAARYAVENDDIGILVKNARDPQWRQVIVLAAGMANKVQKRELLEDLLSEGDLDDQYRYWLHLLTLESIENVIDLEPDIYDRIKERVEALIPPKDFSEAQAVATAGDLAVPHLERSKGHPPSLCIRTLELIGTPAALQAMIGYVNSPKAVVNQWLLPALLRLTAEETKATNLNNLEIPDLQLVDKSLEILTYVRNVGRLTIRNYSGQNFNDLKHLRKANEIWIVNCPEAVSLGDLVQVAELKKVRISGCGKLAALLALTLPRDLEELVLEDLPLSTLQPLSSLIHLGALTSRHLSITDLSGLERMHDLKHLELNSCYDLRNCWQLGKLASLRTLKLMDLPLIPRIDAAALGLEDLKHLHTIYTRCKKYSETIIEMSDTMKKRVKLIRN